MKTALILGTLMVTLLAILLSVELEREPYTVLVGQGCEGKSDIAVALEEDMLPICERIDVHEVREAY